jgi:hypothetical protein
LLFPDKHGKVERLPTSKFHGDVFELHNAAVAPQLEASAIDLKFAKLV